MKRIARQELSVLVRLIVAVLAVVAWADTQAWAQAADAGAPGDWLSRYTGARAVGLGGAFVAVSSGPVGVLWNPATLSRLYQNEISFEATRLFESTSISGFSFAAPARRIPSVGLTMLSLGSGEFERTSELNEPLGTFEERDNAFVFSASQSLSPRLSLGANLKIVQQSVEEYGATGVGTDLGLLFDLTPGLRVGASVLNLGGPTLRLRESDEAFPTEFRGGFSVLFLRGRGTLSAEVDQRSSGPGASLRAGSEFWLHPSMALRVGYDDANATGGFSYQLASGARFDYGVADHELGMTHRFGVSYRFGGFFASSIASPPVFSPTGTQSVTKFQLKSRTKADTQEWSLAIVSASNQVVRQFGGKGVPPAHVMWDGKDESGLPLADGIYNYRLMVVDTEGRQIEGRIRSVEISTGGPQGSVPVLVHE